MRAPRFSPWLLVVTLTAAGAAAAAGYAVTAPERYRATAQLLVAPVSAVDPTFAGIDVLRDAAGKARAAATAAVLVRSPQVADAVRTQLGLRRSTASLLADVRARPVGASDVVDVTVEDTSATAAAQLANAFVDALIAQRTTSFQSRLATAVRRDGELLAGASAGPQATELARRLATLRALQGQADPTLRRASTALTPASSAWPDTWELVGIGAGVGAAAGALLALAAAAARRRRPGLLPEYDRPMAAPGPDRALEALVDRLEARLAAREQALAVRERDLQARIDELRALGAGTPGPAAERERELAERERQLEGRVAAVTQRELEVARLAARQVAAQAPGPAPAGGPDLRALERLVEERGVEFPERVDEWHSTLFFLRDYAAADGTLPDSFDWLVQDTFRDLL